MRVLVVDDSILFRKVMTDVLSSLPDVEVVGQAANGKIAIQKVQDLKPDVLTLDLEMPEMDGLAVLDALKAAGNMPPVIVVSALSKQGGKLTLQALQKGAFDFITKPDKNSPDESRKELKETLAPRIKALSLRLGVRGILRGTTPTATVKATPGPQSAASTPTSPTSSGSIGARMARLSGNAKPDFVLIGVSTGGPNALAVVIPSLPLLGVPIFVVQHMPPIFTQTLAESLNSKSKLAVCEAADGMVAEPNKVYIAPGGFHMKLAAGPGDAKLIQITQDPPENNCRPAVDYLFRSAASHFPGRSMGVILTGMGSDGTIGLKLLKQHGCFVIAQNEASCVVYGMPKAAVDAGVTDEVLPLDAIAGRISTFVRNGS